MKKHPLEYIKSYGLKLFLVEFIILFLNKFHVLDNLKQNLTIKKNNMIAKKLETKYNYLIDKYKDVDIEYHKNDNLIWVFWYQGEKEMPELVKLCIENMRKKLKSHKVIIISKENLKDYIELPDYIYEKFNQKIIGPAHFSDIVRAKLLSEHGGIWLDATIYISEPIPKKEINDIKTIKFHCEEKTSISKGRWCGFFLGKINPKLYKFMYDFYLEYWQEENIIIDYFLMDYMIDMAYKNFIIVKKDIDNNKINNQNIHKLEQLLNKDFNIKEYEELKKTNKLHKLSYKIELKEQNDTKLTYWGYIKGGQNEK